MADRVIQRNDTEARWIEINPILAMGEIGIVTDGLKGFKVGDGILHWNELPYPEILGGIVNNVYGTEGFSLYFDNANHRETFNAFAIKSLYDKFGGYSTTLQMNDAIYLSVNTLEENLQSQLDTLAEISHSHSNKSTLDSITNILITNWNSAYSFVQSITGADTNTIIDKWNEVVSFLNGIDDGSTLQSIINNINTSVNNETNRALAAEAALGIKIENINTKHNAEIENWQSKYNLLLERLEKEKTTKEPKEEPKPGTTTKNNTNFNKNK